MAKAETSQETGEMGHVGVPYPPMHHHHEISPAWGVVIGVILGFFLKLLSDYLHEKRRFKKDFLEIKHCIPYMKGKAEINLELRRLKSFFTGNFKVLETQENNHFFQKWLVNIEGHQWDKKEELEEMLNDLNSLKI